MGGFGGHELWPRTVLLIVPKEFSDPSDLFR